MIVEVHDTDAAGLARQGAHSENSTARFFQGDPAAENKMGIKAEVAFGQLVGLDPDYTLKPKGDGGIDFTTTLGGRTVTIDVKGARTPIYLFLKEKDAHQAADIMVLARVTGDEVWFLGWEHKSIMLAMPVRDFGYGIRNYFRHYSELRPIWQLVKLLRG